MPPPAPSSKAKTPPGGATKPFNPKIKKTIDDNKKEELKKQKSKLETNMRDLNQRVKELEPKIDEGSASQLEALRAQYNVTQKEIAVIDTEMGLSDGEGIKGEPDDTQSIPEDIPEVPKDSPEVPKDIPEVPKDIPEVPKDISDVPQESVEEGNRLNQEEEHPDDILSRTTARKNGEERGTPIKRIDMGRRQMVIVEYGPRNACTFRIEAAREVDTTMNPNELDDITIQKNRRGEERDGKAYRYKKGDLKALQGVAWMFKTENEKLAVLGDKEGNKILKGKKEGKMATFPTTYTKCRWADGVITWETRNTVWRCWAGNNELVCNRDIRDLASQQEKRYAEWRAGTRASADRSPTPDDRFKGEPRPEPSEPSPEPSPESQRAETPTPAPNSDAEKKARIKAALENFAFINDLDPKKVPMDKQAEFLNAFMKLTV